MSSLGSSNLSATTMAAQYSPTLRHAKVPVVHLSACRARWEPFMGMVTIVETKPVSRWRSSLFMFSLISLGIIIAQSILLGEIAIALYGLYALIRRVPSVITFKLALVALVATIMAMLVHHTISAANIFATYTFLLLVVGVLSLLRELPAEAKAEPTAVKKS